MKILIAEDDAASRDLLRRRLEKRGYEVVETATGVEAWERLQREHFPIVITDWLMPDMDGLELCRAIRERSGPAYIYLLLLTVKTQRQDRMAAMQAGADDYLSKPLDNDDLVARLNVAQRVLAMQESLTASNAYLALANQRFMGLFQGLPTACVTYDDRGVIQDWNQAAETLFGLPGTQVVQRPLWETIEPTSAQEAIQERIARVFETERFENIEWTYQHPDGIARYLLCSTFPLQTASGTVLGAISTYVDISPHKALEEQLRRQFQLSLDLNVALEAKQRELEAANAQLARLSATDALTGLSNLRHFHDVLLEQYSLSVRHGLPLSLIMFDVDHFKQYNDAFGHPAGDDALRGVATLLQSIVRLEDIVARYGGEEFVILLPSTDSEGAKGLAARLQSAMARETWPRRAITASMGISTLSPAIHNPSELIIQADQALYASKHEGRNCWTHNYDLPASHDTEEKPQISRINTNG